MVAWQEIHYACDTYVRRNSSRYLTRFGSDCRLFIQALTGSELLWDQAGLFLFGLFMAAAYVVTRNLFVAVELHALVNGPTPPIRASSQIMLDAVWAGLAVVLLLAWRAASVAHNRTRRLRPVE